MKLESTNVFINEDEIKITKIDKNRFYVIHFNNKAQTGYYSLNTLITLLQTLSYNDLSSTKIII